MQVLHGLVLHYIVTHSLFVDFTQLIQLQCANHNIILKLSSLKTKVAFSRRYLNLTQSAYDVPAVFPYFIIRVECDILLSTKIFAGYCHHS